MATYDSGDVLLYNACGICQVLGEYVTNEKKSYKLEPLEELKIKNLNTKNYEKINIKSCEKKKIKPGLYNQTAELIKLMFNKKNNLCSLKESHKVMSLTNKIY